MSHLQLLLLHSALLKTSLSIFVNHDDEDNHVDSDDGNSGNGDVDDSDNYALCMHTDMIMEITMI